jgi:hypothetical protein
MQQQNLLEDYWFIYRRLTPKELTGIDAHYDTAQELGPGTFVTVMKATWASGGPSRSSTRRSSARRITVTKTTAALAAADSMAIAVLPQGRRERERSTCCGNRNICRLCETFPPNEASHTFCEFFLFNFS